MSPLPLPTIQTIRILLIDDQGIVRDGIRLLLESQPGLTVVGEASASKEAIALAARELPDIILLDLDLGNHDSIDLIPKLLASASGSRMLILTSRCDPEAHYAAVRRGAMGLLRKSEPGEVLIKAIKKLHAGEVWLDRLMMARVLTDIQHAHNGKPTLTSEIVAREESVSEVISLLRPREDRTTDFEAAKIATLTEREREVVTLIGKGLKNKQIAEQLFISVTTVRHHLTAIFDKLGVSDRLELAIYSYRHGLAQIPIRPTESEESYSKG
jgi:DNA-binding NarL/FixJ family response regulator